MGKQARGGSGIKDRNISSTAGIKVSKLDRATLYEDFSVYGASKGHQNLGLGGVVAATTADLHHHLYTGKGNIFTYVNIGTQTILGPQMTATGLDIGLDQTANDGVEIFTGSVGASGRPFEIGRDPSFFFRLKFSIADVSGTDDFHVGFRKASAYTGTIDDYLDMATLSIVTAADPAAIQIETILNNGGTTTTDTTDTLADGVETEWEIRVSNTGVVTYLIDGMAPSTTAAFTFDDGDLVIPFVQQLQDTGLTGELNLIEWEVGYV